jgi:DnaJ family protein C protein 28
MEPQEKPKKIQHPALRLIEEAMERGEFDNLPGKGKPLPWDSSDLSDPLVAAAKVRKNAEAGAPWQFIESEIENGLARAERDIQAAYHRHRSNAQARLPDKNADENWRKALKQFEERLAEVNSRILTFNLLLPRPLTHLQKPRLQVEARLKSLGINSEDEAG